MSTIPEIIIEPNRKKEVEKFLIFLNNPQFPQIRNYIFDAFPEIENKNLTKATIKDFVDSFYKKNNDKIDQIINKEKRNLDKKGKIALTTLAELMNYNWEGNVKYKIIPTILPFSPLEKKVFYFSILGRINNKDTKDVLYVAMHEISHLVLYDMLDKLKKEKQIPVLSENAINYFKEMLAVVLINQKALLQILGIKIYLGNPEIQDIQIQKESGKIVKFTEFLDESYKQIKSTKKQKFTDFVIYISKILNNIEPELNEKRKLWNKKGSSMKNDEKSFNKYKEPIKIKGLVFD